MGQNGSFRMSFLKSLTKEEKIHMAISQVIEVRKVINPVGNKTQRSISLAMVWHQVVTQNKLIEIINIKESFLR
jgi:hypothetical protein